MGQLYQGDRNAGRPLILEGGLDWREMSLSPKDMDWLSGRTNAARDIALAFGVPAQMIGLPDAQTYANMEQARLAFYEETVLPQITRVISGIDHWLCPMYRDRPDLDFDPDSISALTDKRQAQWTKIQTANFLTLNEKREAAGYGPIAGGDRIDDTPAPTGKSAQALRPKYSPDQPRVPAGNIDGGQWTSGGGGSSSDDATNELQSLISPIIQTLLQTVTSYALGGSGDSLDGSDTPGGGDEGDISQIDDSLDGSANVIPASYSSTSFDINGATNYLDENASTTSTGNCGHAVAEAIKEGGGLSVTPWPQNAKDFGPWLENNGFGEAANWNRDIDDPSLLSGDGYISGYTPQAGDVVVLQPYPNGNQSGHTAMYDGDQWVSDFTQRDLWGGSGYRNYRSNYSIFRHGFQAINL
jgi:hypothetical protein